VNAKILILAALAVFSVSLDAAAGDAKAAADKARTLCAGCHGPNGVSTNPLWPNLAGQQAGYLAKAMHDYKGGQRNDPVMSGIAGTLTDAEMDDLAAYFAALPPDG
jgi:cytochrome c553